MCFNRCPHPLIQAWAEFYTLAFDTGLGRAYTLAPAIGMGRASYFGF